METLQSAINMMTKGCFMASVDLKDAYYSVPIHETIKNILSFPGRIICTNLPVCQMDLLVHQDCLQNY